MKWIQHILKHYGNPLPDIMTLVMFMSVTAPMFYDDISAAYSYEPIILWYPLVQSICIASALAAIFSIIRMKILLKISIYIAGFFCFVDLFCLYHFNVRFNESLVMFVFQTDPAEAKGFISQYLLTLPTLRAIMAFVAIVAIYSAVKYGASHLRKKWRTIIVTVCLAMSVLSFASVLRPQLFYVQKSFSNSIPVQLYFASSTLYQRRGQITTLQKTMDNIQPVERDPNCPSVIVMVVGESHNKHHSSLYGYEKKTNPELEKELDKGNLYLFTDVVSRWNATGIVMPEIFSTNAAHSGEKWEKSPLLPAVMKKGGYKVGMIDNQLPRHSALIDDFVANFFFNIPDVEKKCFDYRNEQLTPIDMKAVDMLCHIDSLDAPQFVILHLKGQHIPAKFMYPKDQAKFTPADYAPTYTDIQREEIAHYDNACLYNDKVLGAIIDRYRKKDAVIVYFSDHGEEIHDFRNHYGRNGKISNEIAKYVYEVPFFIWCSDEYKQRHPEMVSNISQAVHRPIVNGDVAQIIMDLAGIRCKYFLPQYSGINPGYKPYKRYVRSDFAYDK